MGAFQTIKSRLTMGFVVSLIIFLIVTVVIYAPVIQPYIKPSNQGFGIPLVSPLGIYVSTNDKITEYAEAKTGVFGYSADVYVSFEQSAVNVGDTVKINVEIVNHGTTLHKPYFAVLLMNNSGYVVATFPGDNSVSYLESYSNKPSQWWTGGISDYWIPIRDVDGSMSSSYVSRDAMIAGQGTYSTGNNGYTAKIWFEKQIANMPTQVGQWTVWVFAYDDQYSSPSGSLVSTENAFAYAKASFNVVGKDTQAVQTNDTLNSASALISFGIYLASTYGLFTKFAPWIDAHISSFKGWSKKDKSWLGILLVLSILYVVLYLLNSSHL